MHALLPLHDWQALGDSSGSVWRSESLFTLIWALVLEAGAKGCSDVFVITYYDRVRAALKTFITKVTNSFPFNQKLMKGTVST